MGKRLSLGRVEVLIENLKRELAMQGSTIKGLGWTITNVTAAGGTTSLGVADNGATFVVNTGGGTQTFNLPTPAAGLKFKFIAATTDSNDILILCTSDGTTAADIGFAIFNTGTIQGLDTDPTAPADLCTMGPGAVNHTAGDWVECVCDGTNWWFKGTSVLNSAISFA